MREQYRETILIRESSENGRFRYQLIRTTVE